MTESLGRHVVLGMAGHIDHGKTEIVKALTGTNTDRLKEEIERGMTTDLGFAFLGDDITIIDVPGHEKFVKTMVAGVNTVDVALLVVAADDGVMPQTVEHVEILNLLRIPAGLIAVNKIDLVRKDWLDMVIADVRKLAAGTVLAGAPILPVSAVTGQGIPELKEAISLAAKTVQRRRDTGVFRLPVDRVFTIKGFGTVAAGTVLSGRVEVEDSVELLPRGILLRVRGIQVHGKKVTESSIGFRTALNLMGAEKEDLGRGNVLAEPGFFRAASMMDAHFTLLPTWTGEFKNRTRVHLHVGTGEYIVRILFLDRKSFLPGESGFVQFHFENSVTADVGDRYVVRSFSPVRTLGGGLILETHPLKHKPFEPDTLAKLDRRHRGDPFQLALDRLEQARFEPVSSEDLSRSSGIQQALLESRLIEWEASRDVLRVGKKRWMSPENYGALQRKILALAEAFHQEHPFWLNMSAAELRSRIKQPVDKVLFEIAISDLVEEKKLHLEGALVRLSGHSVRLPPDLDSIKQRIADRFLASPLNPPDAREFLDEFGKKAEDVLHLMHETGELIRLEQGLFLHRTAVENAKAKVVRFLTSRKQATVSEIKQDLGMSRKFALPLLVYFDDQGITVREGDMRRLRE